MFKHIILYAIILTIFISGCKMQTQDQETAPKELLIYCDTTIANAIRELADRFEKRENCTVKIIKDGSGVLLHSIQINQVGDLYLSGCESYIDQAIAEGLIMEVATLGYHHPVMIVAKNNPLNIQAKLDAFTDTAFRAAIADPETSAIGRHTRLMLQEKKIYQQALNHALLVLPDSRSLLDAITTKQVDLTINWLAEIRRQESSTIEILPLPSESTRTIPLQMGLLKTAHHFDLAKRFLSLSSSAEGQALFSRYGFGATSHE